MFYKRRFMPSSKPVKLRNVHTIVAKVSKRCIKLIKTAGCDTPEDCHDFSIDILKSLD